MSATDLPQPLNPGQYCHQPRLPCPLHPRHLHPRHCLPRHLHPRRPFILLIILVVPFILVENKHYFFVLLRQLDISKKGKWTAASPKLTSFKTPGFPLTTQSQSSMRPLVVCILGIVVILESWSSGEPSNHLQILSNCCRNPPPLLCTAVSAVLGATHYSK